MHTGTYLNWVIEHTNTAWWHDSADPAELQSGLERGAIGVTINPFLSSVTLVRNRQGWATEIEPVLLVVALRGDYHLTELAGAELLMSVAPAAQEWFITRDHPREERIGKEVAPEVVERLSTMPGFVKAFEPEGMAAKDFISSGVTQRTLCQFIEAGWRLLETAR